MIFNPKLLAWRQSYNPLIALTMSRVVSLLTVAENGYYADLQWLYKFIEKRDATLMAVLSRRNAAMKKLDWSIKVKEGRKKNARQEDFLNSLYEGINNIHEAVEFLSLASFRGFSHLEKHWNADGDITHLEPVPQWFWARAMPNKDWLYNERATQTRTGKAINRGDFVIREIDSPVNEIALIAFIRKNLSQKDWDGFVETYGIPPIFVELPMGVGNVGATGVDSTTPWQQLAEQVVSDARGVLPNGAKIQTVQDGQRGNNPFKDHITYQDEQITKAATGGLLTSMNESTGLGSGQSESHQNTFRDIAKGEAEAISEVFQRDIDAPALMAKFKSEEVDVYFELHSDELDEKSKTVEDAQKLSSAGYEIETEQLSEKTGYKLVNKADRQKEQQDEMLAKQEEQQKAAQEAQMFGQFGGGGMQYGNRARPGLKKDSSVLLNNVAGALASDPDSFKASLERLLKSLPASLKDANSRGDWVKDLVQK